MVYDDGWCTLAREYHEKYGKWGKSPIRKEKYEGLGVGTVMYSKLGWDECPSIYEIKIDLPFKLPCIGYAQLEIYTGNDEKIGFFSGGIYKTKLPQDKSKYDYTYEKNKEDLKAAAKAQELLNLFYENEGESEFNSYSFDTFDKNS